MTFARPDTVRIRSIGRAPRAVLSFRSQAAATARSPPTMASSERYILMNRTESSQALGSRSRENRPLRSSTPWKGRCRSQRRGVGPRPRGDRPRRSQLPPRSPHPKRKSGCRRSLLPLQPFVGLFPQKYRQSKLSVKSSLAPLTAASPARRRRAPSRRGGRRRRRGRGGRRQGRAGRRPRGRPGRSGRKATE